MLSSSEYYLWEPYVKYRNFILECKNKDYDNSEVLHKHHIIPRHVFVNNSGWNLVNLTVEDHVKAHLLLSDCFEEGSSERIKNLQSARILNNMSIRDKEILNKIGDSYKGEGNPFFGKKHTDESILKIKENSSISKKGKKYEEIYPEKSSQEKDKRRLSVKNHWETLSEDEKSNRISKMSESLKGKMTGDKNPFSTPVLVDGVRYPSITAAANDKEVSQRLLFKRYEVIKLK